MKKYEAPEMEVTLFWESDIVKTSGLEDTEGDYNTGSGEDEGDMGDWFPGM